MSLNWGVQWLTEGEEEAEMEEVTGVEMVVGVEMEGVDVAEVEMVGVGGCLVGSGHGGRGGGRGIAVGKVGMVSCLYIILGNVLGLEGLGQ